VRSRGSLRIRQDGVELPLSEYSDGYRSMVAFTTDLMLNLSGRWDSIATAEGLVLVDELEVHLHPTWRMTAIDRLRTVFPRLRFVATTHDPLCLRGSLKGEVHVLVRDEETKIVEARQRDVPPGLTADELLTGGWFGMATTLDEGTTKLMLEHSRLLLEPKTKVRVERRAELEEQLRERRGTFAETGDERLVRSVLAELRGDQGGLSETQRESAREKILDRVKAKEGQAP
jgi:predicted ATP-dependent endonuclease of OLD family